jgi:hypothetical protein
MSRRLSFALALACCVLMAACGGSMKSSSPGNGVPVSLAIRDAPPNGVAVLFFEASITGVSLQPTDSKKPAVSLMNAPVEVEFGHLQTDTAFLSLGGAAPDSYQSATLTFGDAVLTIVNLWLAEMSSAESRAIHSRPSGNSEPAVDQAFPRTARTVSLTEPQRSLRPTPRQAAYIYIHTYILRMTESSSG